MDNKKLRALRILAGLNQKQLAETADVTQPYISFIETGKAIPTREIREKLAAILKVDSAELFREKV